MEQDRKFRNYCMHLWSPNPMTKEARIRIMEKKAISLTSAAWKALNVKE